MGKKLYYVIVAALSLVGLWALGVRIVEGMAVTALTSYVAWGLWVSVYIYFIGLSAGSFLLSTMIYVFGMHQLEKVGRVALLTALFSLGAGVVFIWIDLGRLERAWEIFTRPQFSSLMTIESWLYLIYMVLIVAELWFLMRNDLAALRARAAGWRQSLYSLLALGYSSAVSPEARRRQGEQARQWIMALGILGIPTAIGVHGGTGAIFAVAIARPYWNGALFPIVFLVSALASGAALVTFIYAALGPRTADSPLILRRVATLTILFIGIDLLLILSEVLVGLYGGVPSEVEVFKAIFEGPYAFVFWIGQLGLAAALPVVMVSLASGERPAVALAAPAAARPRAVGRFTWAVLTVAALIVVGDVLTMVPDPAFPLLWAVSGAQPPALSVVAFWVAQLVLASCVVALLAQRWGSPRFWLGAAGLSTVAGILAVRLNIVIPGMIVPVLERLEQAYQDPRLHYAYFPSGLEWASTVGLIALVVLVFSVAYEVLPTYGVKEAAR